MLLLEPLWKPDGRWSALLVHCSPEVLPPFSQEMAHSPMARLKSYWPSADGLLPALLVKGHSVCAALDTMPPADQLDKDIPRIALAGEPDYLSAQIVRKVATQEEVKKLHGLPLEFCGAWYTRTLERTAPDPAQPVLLELLSQIVHDADTATLEKTIAKAPQLITNLLRLVNSVGMGARRQVNSIHQAIALLGRRQLQRWLQLLLYAEQYGADGGMPPLFVAAAIRAKRLECWARAGWLGDLSADAAFMTGMLSLLDRLFGCSLDAILNPLPLSPAMAAGLLRGEGRIGEALDWLTLAEIGQSDTLAREVCLQGKDGLPWLQAEIHAVGWAYSLLDTAVGT